MSATNVYESISKDGFMILDNSLDKDLLNGIKSDCFQLTQYQSTSSTSTSTSITFATVKAAKFGSVVSVENAVYRGDLTTWLTPEVCKRNNLTFVSKYVQQMIRLFQSMKKDIVLNDYSVQLAVYPGNNTRYVRHLDSSSSSSSLSSSSSRRITTVLYLNEHPEGGQLRIYVPNSDKFIDVDPLFGRIVFFQSDKIEHEVLPTSSIRFAITIWASGPVHVPSSTLPSLLPALSSNSIPKSWILCSDQNFQQRLSSCSIQDKKIFVNIAAYRDSECQHTIYDLFLKASHRYRIHVGVLWQTNAANDGVCYDEEALIRLGIQPQIQLRVLTMDYRSAKGPCWARHIVSSLWQNEDYVLQIDSHMRFRKNWDNYLIEQLEGCREYSQYRKPILTTYPMGYQLPSILPNDIRPTLLVPMKFDEDGILRQSARIIVSWNMTLPLKSPLWASGFSFSDCSMLHDVPYDPLLPFLFFGEELSMAMRLHTHGYDFFAPNEAVLYHLWERSYRPVFQEIQYPVDRESFRLESIRRIKMLSMGSTDQLYGLGTLRSISSFESMVGVDLKACQLLDRSYDAFPLHQDTISFSSTDFKTLFLLQLFPRSDNDDDDDVDQSKKMTKKKMLSSTDNDMILSLVKQFL